MPFANLSISDTFFTWMNRINQQLNWSNALDASNVITLISNSGPTLVLSGSQAKFGITYLTVNPSNNLSDNSAANVASSNIANIIYNYAQSNFNRNNTAIATAYTQANTGYNQANTAYNQANAAYNQANTATTTAAAAATPAMVASAYNQANTATTSAASAQAEAVAAYGEANAAYNQANAAYGQANTIATNSVNGVVILATTAQFLNGVGQRALDVVDTWNAAKEVYLGANTGNLTFDLSQMINGNTNLVANVTLPDPTNFKPGVSGALRFVQPAAGGCYISYGPSYTFPNRITVQLSGGKANTDIITYYTYQDNSGHNNVAITIIKNLG